MKLTLISCEKCFKVFKDKRKLSLHQKSCLISKPGESFLKNHISKPYDKNDKVLPPSQNLSLSFIDEESETDDIVATPILSASSPIVSLNAKETEEENTDPKECLLADTNHQSKIDVQDKPPVVLLSSSNTCQNCKKTFKNNRGLNQHMRKCKNKTTEAVLESSNIGDALPTMAVITETPSSSLPEAGTTVSDVVLNDVSVENFWLKTVEVISNKVNPIYDTIVHWKKNLFKLPSGHSGKAFITEMTKHLFRSLYNQFSLEKYCFILPYDHATTFAPKTIQKKQSKRSFHGFKETTRIMA